MNTKNLNQEITHRLFSEKNVRVYLKREDLSHPIYGGNKIRKLKYHMEEFRKGKFKQIITFGGAWSNHVFASAGFLKENDIPCIGVIRGEEPKVFSDTLVYAQEQNMKLVFVSRELYREKENRETLSKVLPVALSESYIIPEGGGGELGIKGCEEILTEEDDKFDYITCALGTGSTFKGLLKTSFSNPMFLGFPALKDSNFLQNEIEIFLQENDLLGNGPCYELIQDYHFGGYAKVNQTLCNFIINFYKEFGIKLDPIYTGKMLFGIFDLIEKNYFPSGSKILAIHTGGIQGATGIEKKLKLKLYPEKKEV